ncbi:MAG: hypothetical protein R3F37_23270 [Candidatus Competibacteraceae bacterium]
MLALISERLGLNFTQFRRAVLLPQGDFAAFLKADGKSRSELLERITGTEIYTELSKAAHQRAAEEKKQLDDLQHQQDGLRPLDESERQALEQNLTEQQANHRQAEQAQKAVQRIIDWHRRLAELEQLEQTAINELADASQALAQAEPRRQEWRAVQQAQPLRRWVEEYDRTAKERDSAQQALAQTETVAKQAQRQLAQAQQNRHSKETALQQAVSALESARPQLQQARILDQQLTEARQQNSRLEQDRNQANAGLTQVKKQQRQLDKQYQTLRQQYDEVSNWLVQQSHLTDLVQQWERWDNELQRYIDADSEARNAHRQLQKIGKRHADLTQKCAENNDQLTHVRQSADEAQDRLRALENTAQPIDLEALAQQRNAYEMDRERLQTALNVIQDGEHKQRELNKTRADHQQIRERVKLANQAYSEQSILLQRQQAVLNEAEDALQRALIARKEDVRSLRSTLRDGEPCPVCGSTAHPWQQDSTPMWRWVDDQQQHTQELKEQVQTLTAACSQQKTLHEQANQQLAELTAWEQTLVTELTVLQQRWQGLPRDDSLPDGWLDADFKEKLNERLQSIAAALAEIKAAEQRGLQLNQQINHARRTLDQRREQRDQLHNTHEELQKALQQLNTAQATQKTILDRAGQTVQQAYDHLNGPLARWPAWEKALTGNAEGLRVQCQQQVQEWRQRQQAKDELDAKLQSLQLDRKDAENAVRSAQEQAQNQADLFKTHQEKLHDLHQQRAILFDGRSADAEEQSLEQANKEARVKLEQANRVLETAQNEFTGARTGVEHWQNELRHRQTAHADAQQRLNGLLDEYGLGEKTLRLRLERDSAWLEQERSALDALRMHHERAQERLRERCNNREQHQHTDPPCQRLEDAQIQLEQARTASETAHQAWVECNVRLTRDNEKRAQSTQLHSAYKKQRQRWEVWESLRTLIGSHDGGVFERMRRV